MTVYLLSLEFFFIRICTYIIHISDICVSENNERARQRVAGMICRKTRQPTRPRTPRKSLILRIASK